MVRRLKRTRTTNRRRSLAHKNMREWANSLKGREDDRGVEIEAPSGETVDLSLRRYLNAEPMRVTIEEDQITYKKMMREYIEYKKKLRLKKRK